VTRNTRVVAVVFVTAVAASLASIASRDAAVAVCLGGGIVAGEFFVLRLENDAELPLSFALLPTVAIGLALSSSAALLGGAYVIGAAVRGEPRHWSARARICARRIVVSVSTVAITRGALDGLDGRTSERAVVLGALFAGCAVLVASDVLLRAMFQRRSSLEGRGPMAWSALMACALLMAVAFRDGPGGAGLGLFGPLLFSIPLWIAWYSFARLDSVTRTYRQTIDALSLAPELAGLVPPGHGARVAIIARGLAEELALTDDARDNVEAAALLHHVGEVTLEHPEVLGRPPSASDVTAVSAAMLRDLGPLAAAGAIVAGQPFGPREDTRWHGAHVRLLSQVLRVSSAFDDASQGDPSRMRAATAALRADAGTRYDSAVLDALDRLLVRRASTAVPS
jgi:hypothetical protein